MRTLALRASGLSAVVVAALVVASARADWFADTGYTSLQAELGAALPTGAGVRVAQVESPLDATTRNQYLPDTIPATSAEFLASASTAAAKVFTNLSSAAHPAAQVSNHATAVGQSFYGSASSLAPGISSVGVYEANDWLHSFLNWGTYGAATPPLAPGNVRVFNQSWLTGFNPTNPWAVDALHRIDYLTATSDVIQVTGVDNAPYPAYPVFANAFNVIAVGRADGQHTPGTVTAGISDNQGLYNASRTRPDVVTTSRGGDTSSASGLVAGGMALLVQAGHSHPAWSLNRSYVPDSASGYAVYDAERFEVLKAATLAGASRSAITGYHATTVNGLDPLYGAGQFNIASSYHILAGGEADGLVTAPAAGAAHSDVPAAGFSFNAGLALGSSAYYPFVASSTPLAAALAWDAHVAAGVYSNNGFSVFGSATLPGFRLAVLDAGTSQAVAVSASTAGDQENSENLCLSGLVPGKEYVLRVSRTDAGTLPAWEYGLAWLGAAAPVNVPVLLGDANRDGLVNLADLAILKANYGQTGDWAHGDFNGDGLVNLADLAILSTHMNTGATAGAPGLGPVSGPAPDSPPAVPEPASLPLLLAATAALLARRRLLGPEPACRSRR